MNKPNIFILKGNYERYREIINKSEFIVGVIFGIIFSIPYLNYCCCLLYVLSGVISAHIRSKEGDLSDEEYSDCGGLSGLVAGGITFILDTTILATMEVSYYFIMITIISFIIYLSLGAIFGAIGGILYGKLKNK